jgi:hypothetical protein
MKTPFKGNLKRGSQIINGYLSVLVLSLLGVYYKAGSERCNKNYQYDSNAITNGIARGGNYCGILSATCAVAAGEVVLTGCGNLGVFVTLSTALALLVLASCLTAGCFAVD